MTHWWQDLFDEKYLRMFAEARPPMRTEQEVEALLAVLEQHCDQPADVLDLACGYGRIALPLAQAGHQVTGLDLSPVLLDAAKTASARSGVTVTWQAGDMRTLPAGWTAQFDAVLNMFSAFGYFDDAADNQQVLAEVALPVAGLMSLKPHEEVRDELMVLRAAARNLGVTLEEPFLQLAFLALPVIPHLKITDHGMVDVDRFEVIAAG